MGLPRDLGQVEGGTHKVNRVFDWHDHPLAIIPLACGMLREACQVPRDMVAHGLRHERVDHYRFSQVWWRADQQQRREQAKRDPQ